MSGITGFQSGSKYKYISSATTTQVTTGKGVLRALVFNKPTDTKYVKIIDGTSGSTENIGKIIHSGAVPYRQDYNLKFTTGLRIVTEGADDLTVIYD